MVNYIKSEYYRLVRSASVYYFTGGVAGLSLLLNILLHYFGGRHYSTTSFSYATLVANPMIFVVMAFIIAALLYEENQKNGNLKNTVASGISRVKIFIGECVVSTVVATISMLVTLTVYIASAVLFLKEAGPVQLTDLLLEVPAIYLIAVAGIISAVFLIEFFEKVTVSTLVWLLIWQFVPQFLFYLGLRIGILQDIAMWLPKNFFAQINEQHVNTQECITVWDTAEGWTRCLLSGGLGIVFFGVSGASILHRRDL